MNVYNGTTVLGTGSGQGTVVADQTTTVRITINLDSGNLQVIVDWSLFSSITFSGRSVSGLAFSSGYLWAIHQPAVFNNTFKIAKIDPSTRQVVLESGNINGNGRGITVGSGALWVTEATADVVSKFDTATFTQLASFSTPGTEPCGIAFDGTNLWLSDPYFQKIYKLNTNGGVLSNFAIPNYHRNGLEWNNGGLWTPTDSNMVSFYTTTGTITSTKILQFPTGYYGFIDIAIGDGNAYISSHEKIFIQTWP